MTDEERRPEAEDAEGHGIRRGEDSTGDAEGHAIRRGEDSTGDDVEGHRPRRPTVDQTGEDDVEGHRPRRPTVDQTGDDVEGHRAGRST